LQRTKLSELVPQARAHKKFGARMMSRCASRRRTGRLTGSESPESPDPDSLVFDRFRLSEWLVHRYLCKIFHRVGVLIVKSVNLNCRAQCARKSSPMARCLSLLSLHKSLFHRIFLNFRKVRKSLRRQSISRVDNSILIVQSRCVVSRGVRVSVSVSDTAVFLSVL
jgi:hypothetical protein